jgi:hypothetical protein
VPIPSEARAGDIDREGEAILSRLGPYTTSTAYEDVVQNRFSMEELHKSEREVRARIEEVTALIDRLRADATPS